MRWQERVASSIEKRLIKHQLEDREIVLLLNMLERCGLRVFYEEKLAFVLNFVSACESRMETVGKKKRILIQ